MDLSISSVKNTHKKSDKSLSWGLMVMGFDPWQGHRDYTLGQGTSPSSFKIING